MENILKEYITPERIGSYLFNPIESFYKHTYEIRVSQNKLNRSIKKKIQLKQGRLQDLSVEIGSDSVAITGKARAAKRYLYGIFRVEYIFFSFTLYLDSVHDNYIAFRVADFRASRDPHKRMDWLRVVDRYTRLIQDRLLQEFNSDKQSPLSAQTKDSLVFVDFNYFLRDVPQIMGKVQLEGIFLEQGAVNFIGKSNFFLMTTLGVLSTNMADIHAVTKEDLDIFSAVWNILR